MGITSTRGLLDYYDRCEILAINILNSNKIIKGNVNNKFKVISGGAIILATTKQQNKYTYDSV